MTARRTLLILTLATFAIPCIALAERTETRLDGNDWTLDGIPVLVPHCWNKIDAADGNPALADDTKIYSAVPATSYLRATRTYSRPLPGAKPGRRYFIRCEGASQKATVRVNGVAIGSHKGSFTAFCYEATAAMKPDGNRLDIEVSNEYDPTIPPASGGFNIHGGLYRSVWLIETDPVCIDPTIYGGPGVRVFPSMDGTVRVEADVSGADDAVVDWEPKKVENPRLWSPEEPNVYTVKVTVRKGEWSDSVEQPFGFRTTEIRADGFYLNGVKRKVRGVSRHQDLEGLGWEVSDAQEELDIRLVKAAGADGLRLAHYPQRENVYSLCDRYGLMVWSEIPVVNELGGDAFMENAKETLREMIAQHRNHPCVCWWGMWNEIFNMASPDAAWARKAFEFAPLAAELDPSRPIVAASYKEIGRVSPEALATLNRSVPNICYNIYPGWYVQPDISNSMKRELDVFFAQNDVQTTALSEYGVGGSVHQHQNPPEKPKTTAMFHPEEWQTKQLTDDLRDITADGRLWGSFVWAMFDFSHDGRREGDRYGILDKGIVTRDRAILKDAFYLYKANWNPEPLLHLCSKRMTTTTNAVCEVMCFSNVGDVALKVNGETVATATPDSVKSVTFAGVRLAPGANEIVVEAGGLRDTAHWTLEAEEPAYTPEEWNLKARGDFAADRFGIFITWGLYSILGSSRELSPEAKKLDREAYERVADGFYPSAFDAKEWAAAIKRSGARYVTFVSRHHDGFALWPSKVDEWNVGRYPFKRDITGELAAACREQGLGFNLYYSLLDWHRPDYTPGVKWICEARYLAEQKPDYVSYKRYMMGQIRELLDNYRPDMIWFDGEWDHYDKDHDGDFDWDFDEIYDLIHSRRALIANNHHKMIRPKEDIQLFERDLPGVGTSHSKGQPLLDDRPVEQCDITQRKTWGWQISAPFISPQESIALVVRAAAKGSNLLLNVGPDVSGRFPAKAVEILDAMGKWFEKNGDSIYGTVAGGVGTPDRSVVSTRKGDTLYIHFIDPAVKEFTFTLGGETRTVACPRESGDTYDVVVPVKLSGAGK